MQLEGAGLCVSPGTSFEGWRKTTLHPSLLFDQMGTVQDKPANKKSSRYCQESFAKVLSRIFRKMVSRLVSGSQPATGFGLAYWAFAAVGTAIVAAVTKPRLPESPKQTSKSVSEKVKWDLPENNKHHIKFGSKNNPHDWSPFNVDPKDPNSWDKILPILKKVVDEGEKIKTDFWKNSEYLVHYYELEFPEFASKVLVKIV